MEKSKADTIAIMLQPKASKEGEALTLGQLALVYGKHRSAFLDVEIPVSLIEANESGMHSIRRNVLEEYLKLNFDSHQFYFSGRDRVMIDIQNTWISSGTILLAARTELQHQLSRYSDEFSIENISEVNDVGLAQPNINIRVKTVDRGYVSNREQVWVDLLAGEEVVVSIPVWFKVAVYQQTWVAKSDHGSGDRLYAHNFNIEKKNIAGLDVVSAQIGMNDLSMYRFKRPSYENDVLVWGILEEIPDVEHGQQVQVKSRYKNVEVMTEAIALSDGNKGDYVLLKPLHSALPQYHYKAMVVGQNQTAVEN